MRKFFAKAWAIIITVYEFLGRKHRVATAIFLWKGKYRPEKIVLAQIVPMRRCNLACTYCNEYDKHSTEIPLNEVKGWIDKLAELGTLNITISGGEPMLHTGIYDIIGYIRSKKIMAGLITNGYTLTEKNIKRLNESGLQDLQISIDNVEKDDVSEKSLSFYESKNIPRMLQQLAKFNVNFNSVVGGGVNKASDALTITRRAFQLGFSSTVGIIHDEDGLLKELTPEEAQIYEQIKKISGKSLSFAKLSRFQDELVEKKESPWECRAGARYVYICEHGRVQLCSQHRICKNGAPHHNPVSADTMLDIPIMEYTKQDFDREFNTKKWCTDTCTIQCVRLVSLFDEKRDPQFEYTDYVQVQTRGLNPELVDRLRDQ